MEIEPDCSISVNLASGLMSGRRVGEIVRTLADLAGIFADEQARRSMPQEQPVYRVQSYTPVEEGVNGGLFWGVTFLYPGRVGDEYFMTKGHFHTIRNRAEYYVTVNGFGALILMEEDGSTRLDWMMPGTVHYIPGHTAHRVANTGSTTLSFLACWPSDAGHDYGVIAEHGFGGRVMCVNNAPALVPQS